VVRLTATQLEALVEFAAKFPGCMVELSDWMAVLKALSAAARSATTAPANAPNGHPATAAAIGAVAPRLPAPRLH
jgi:hypothetical protein